MRSSTTIIREAPNHVREIGNTPLLHLTCINRLEYIYSNLESKFLMEHLQ